MYIHFEEQYIAVFALAPMQSDQAAFAFAACVWLFSFEALMFAVACLVWVKVKLGERRPRDTVGMRSSRTLTCDNKIRQEQKQSIQLDKTNSCSTRLDTEKEIKASESSPLSRSFITRDYAAQSSSPATV